MLDISVINWALIGVSTGQVSGAWIISSALANGYFPVARTKRVTPRDQTSLAGLLSSSLDMIVSGDR